MPSSTLYEIKLPPKGLTRKQAQSTVRMYIFVGFASLLISLYIAYTALGNLRLGLGDNGTLLDDLISSFLMPYTVVMIAALVVAIKMVKYNTPGKKLVKDTGNKDLRLAIGMAIATAFMIFIYRLKRIHGESFMNELFSLVTLFFGIVAIATGIASYRVYKSHFAQKRR